MIPTRLLRRPRVVIVGCGDVGSRMIPMLSRRFKLLALNRQLPAVNGARRLHGEGDAGIIPVFGDLDARDTLQRIGALAASAAGVFHFAPPPSVSNTDLRTQAFLAAVAAHRATFRASGARHAPRASRFAGVGRVGGVGGIGGIGRIDLISRSARSVIVTDAGALQRHSDARAEADRHTEMRHPRPRRFSPQSLPVVRRLAPSLRSMSASPLTRVERRRPTAGKPYPDPLRIVYASTTGVYGDCAGALINETRPVNPANARAIRRVSAERQLRAAGARGVCSPVILRIPGIYAAGRLPEARLRKGTPALRAEDDVFTSHIHADDLAAIAVRAWRKGRPQRLYHASDNSRMKMGEYFERVADALQLPHPRRISREQAERELEPVMLSFMRESRRLDNRRLSAELAYRLRYPCVDTFLAELTGR